MIINLSNTEKNEHNKTEVSQPEQPVNTSFVQSSLTDNVTTLPIYSEELNVTIKKADAGKGVRVNKSVIDEPFLIDENLIQVSFTVKHISINQILPFENAPVCRYEGSTYIVPVFEEVLVVEKRLLLKEEIHVIKSQTKANHKQTVLLKKEHITINEFDDKALT